MFIDHLPSESATQTALRDDLSDEQWQHLLSQAPTGKGPWSHGDLLTVRVLDEVRYLTWLYLVANSKQGSAPAPPEPTPRPGVRRGHLRAVPTVEELRDRNPAGFDFLMRRRQRGA